MCSKNLDFWEQAAFNQLVRSVGARSKSDSDKPQLTGQYADRLQWMYKGASIPTGVLPVSQFCSGHTAFVQNLPERLGKRPYALHATFQFAGTNGKRHRMREWQVWQDDPAYYNPPSGMLALGYTIPEALLRPGGKELMTVEQHFELVNWQLARIRTGLLLAELTGRVLIMPPLWCGMDRWWAPHTGRIPGSQMPLPIRNCPLDHVFNLEAGFKPERIREYSFLSNKLTPHSVKTSQLNISLPPPRGDGSVRAALQDPAAKHAKVLRIIDPSPAVFQLVLSDAERASFVKRAHNYLGIWCCIRPLERGKPGHIWYDLFWDVVPHKDRWGHEWQEAWIARPSK
mmetsp:Transcript_8558/g.22534  ORF Transcript_8558/g.22534 Transcript_8558/m.22534 type:complete len:342 (+) Transcript_8558:952-1977(+)